MGSFDHESNGTFVKLHSPISFKGNQVIMLRIRKPDPYRMHVGCCDFKAKILKENSKNLREIVRPEYNMIEFFDFDFDVLAYVVGE